MKNRDIIYLSHALVCWIGYYYTRIISHIFTSYVEDQIEDNPIKLKQQTDNEELQK